MLRSLTRHFVKPGRFPTDLVLVRNGISELSVALREAESSSNPYMANRLISRHDSKWRLIDTGVEQATAAGRWLRRHFKKFDVTMTGEYIRSLETASLLAVRDAQWMKSLYLRSRDRGSLGQELATRSPEEVQRLVEERNRDRFYWTPPNGESLAHLALRTDRVLNWLRQHVPPSGSALIVTHKDVMESIRIAIEQVTQLDYESKIGNPPENMRLDYGSILWYTRRNPRTGERVPAYRWMCVATPWKNEGADPLWKRLHIRHNASEDLLAEVSDVPHIFNDD